MAKYEILYRCLGCDEVFVDGETSSLGPSTNPQEQLRAMVADLAKDLGWVLHSCEVDRRPKAERANDSLYMKGVAQFAGVRMKWIEDSAYRLTMPELIAENETVLDELSPGPATLVIKNCGKCPYVSHSGAFTPGGAKDTCGHPEAFETFAAHVDQSDPNQDRYHWRHRVVDRELPPPTACPLRRAKSSD